jgi:hypothetical protein
MKKAQALAPAFARTFKVTSLAAATALVFSSPVSAFQFEKGEWSGSVDTTLAYGLGVRVEDPDQAIIGTANGGTAYSVNGDDGNLNFKQGDIFSNVFKVSTDLEINRGKYGAFFRVNALYDDVIAHNRVAKRPVGTLTSPAVGQVDFTKDANDLAGERIEIFDAFIYGDLDIGERRGGWKVGNQVLSWGESTFIQNSINAINPIDVSKFRVPGAELKEALIPVGLVSGSIELTENTSLEAFYQLNWRPFRIDPRGSYFSSNDFGGEGGAEHGVLLRFGDVSDQNEDSFSVVNGLGPDGRSDFVVSRAADQEARDEGQFGFAYRVYAPSLNDTEFGFYFMNYHSRLPVVSGRTASNATATAAAAAANNAAVQAVALGQPADQIAAAAAINALVSASTGSAQYFLEYPEDIQLFGASFNTMLNDSGVALQGEISHRLNVPLQLDDVELLLAAIGAASKSICAADTGTNATLGAGYACSATSALQGTQFGNSIGDDTAIPGWIERDVSQVQATATKIFPNLIGAERLILISEFGLNHVHNMPDKDQFRLEVSGTYLSANPVAADLQGTKGFSTNGDFADATSWGYVLGGRLEYSNAIGAVNLKPKFSFKHDVDGNSPGPGGSFLENRKAVTLGVDFDYQLKWSGGIAYTNFYGAGNLNLSSDRDFVALNAKYSF